MSWELWSRMQLCTQLSGNTFVLFYLITNACYALREIHRVPVSVLSCVQLLATQSNILAWKIPWMEEPGRLQSMGSQRVGHDWATSLSLCFATPWIVAHQASLFLGFSRQEYWSGMLLDHQLCARSSFFLVFFFVVYFIKIFGSKLTQFKQLK